MTISDLTPPVGDIEYVPTPPAVLDQMIEAANLREHDVVYDLGCGDARLLVAAAERYEARGRGFDLDPARVLESRTNVDAAGLSQLVTIEQRDFFDVDLRPATVVMLYLSPELNVRLLPQLRQLNPGARIIAHDFDIAGIDFEQVWVVRAPNHRARPKMRDHLVLKWTAPI